LNYCSIIRDLILIVKISNEISEKVFLYCIGGAVEQAEGLKKVYSETFVKFW